MKRLGREFVDSPYPDYFTWLCEMVCVDGRYTDESYWILAKALWDTDFHWVLGRDENRARSVSVLRNRYVNIVKGEQPYDGPPTVFEVLVMLAENMFDMLDELDGEDRRPIYFWEMIDNLGLSNYSDQRFDEDPDKYDIFQSRIDRKLQRWMDRLISYNGHGGLFPLKDPKEDQANVELWYQMNAYIMENY